MKFGKQNLFPKTNINYTTEFCSVVLSILRKESKFHSDFRLSDNTYIVSPPSSLKKIAPQFQSTNDTVSHGGLGGRIKKKSNIY